MLKSLKLTMRTGKYMAGIYEAGDTDKCYAMLFVTDSGRVLPVNHRVVSAEDLLEVYGWGREDAFAELGKPMPGYDDDLSPEQILGVSPSASPYSLSRKEKLK